MSSYYIAQLSNYQLYLHLIVYLLLSHGWAVYTLVIMFLIPSHCDFYFYFSTFLKLFNFYQF